MPSSELLRRDLIDQLDTVDPTMMAAWPETWRARRHEITRQWVVDTLGPVLPRDPESIETVEWLIRQTDPWVLAGVVALVQRVAIGEVAA